jgi:hypothetical protein
MKESEFDKSVVYTLRIELVNGRVLLYGIDTQSKQELIETLRDHAGHEENENPLAFILFETSDKRQVLVNIESVVRITFCFDYAETVKNPRKYYDNFGILDSAGVELEERQPKNGELEMHVVQEEYIPDGIVLHKGPASVDLYFTNPIVYNSLDEEALAGLDIEAEGAFPLRQFINLTDDEGEETFIPMNQIIVLEVAAGVISSTE